LLNKGKNDEKFKKDNQKLLFAPGGGMYPFGVSVL